VVFATMGSSLSQINCFSSIYQLPSSPSSSKYNPPNSPIPKSPASPSLSPSKQLISALKSLSPTKLLSSNSRNYKIFHFIYDGNQQRLKVFNGTPVFLIWRALFQQIGVLKEGSLDKEDELLKKVSLVDSNGCFVVFSPEHVPDNEVFYVKFDGEVKPVMVYMQSEIEKSNGKESTWRWSYEWNRLYCGYSIDHGCRVQTKKSFMCRSTSLPILISNRNFKKGSGIYKWRITFKEQMNGNHAGIISEDEICFPRKCSTFGTYLPSVPWFYKTSQYGTGPVVLFVLDMNKLQLTINGHLIDDLPETVYAGICFNMSSEMEANLTFDNVQRIHTQ